MAGGYESAGVRVAGSVVLRRVRGESFEYREREPQKGECRAGRCRQYRNNPACSDEAQNKPYGEIDSQRDGGQTQQREDIGQLQHVAFFVTAEHPPVVGDRRDQQRRGQGSAEKGALVESLLCCIELRETHGKGKREKESEEHLDAESSHA